MSKSELEKGLSTSHRYKAYSAYYYRGTVLYWLILIIFFVSVLSLPFLKVDVSVQSQGVIRTLNQVSPIHSPLTAQIISILVQENSLVYAGDTLVWLNRSGIDHELVHVDQQLKMHEIFLRDLDLLLTAQQIKPEVLSSLYQKEWADFKSDQNQKKRKLEKVRVDYNRSFGLYQEGVIPNVNFLEDSFRLQAAIDDLEVAKTGQFANWEKDRKDYFQVVNELSAKLENLHQKRNKHFIIAPFTGFILDFNGKGVGSFMQENELIARLSPREKLLAECYVRPSDIGLISDSMVVQFQVGAFPYNEWGLATGKVVSIAKDVVEMEGNWYYKVRCQLNQNFLELKNGVRGSFKKGMDLTGRFIVTKRSLYQLLFDNVDDWLNPKIVQKELDK
ncbi:MAG: HlyD family efflux transporter periplasmic adaptor subunit [Marinilabiliaceae bacterium]|nr:HlyD family efflux transporter periplasmic adaptor subunit [Marinilabiliaceae bacterium]